MYLILLLIVLLFPSVTWAEQLNYTEILSKWSHTVHPEAPFAAKIVTIKPVLGSMNVVTGVLMMQVHFTYKWGVESIILLLKNEHVLGWVFAGEADEEEPAEEKSEVFSQKDAA